MAFNKKNNSKKAMVDPLSDYELRRLGIRGERLFVDIRVFSKTPQEKLQLKKAKKEHKAYLLSKGITGNQLNASDPMVVRARF